MSTSADNNTTTTAGRNDFRYASTPDIERYRFELVRRIIDGGLAEFQPVTPTEFLEMYEVVGRRINSYLYEQQQLMIARRVKRHITGH